MGHAVFPYHGSPDCAEARKRSRAAIPSYAAEVAPDGPAPPRSRNGGPLGHGRGSRFAGSTPGDRCVPWVPRLRADRHLPRGVAGGHLGRGRGRRKRVDEEALDAVPRAADRIAAARPKECTPHVRGTPSGSPGGPGPDVRARPAGRPPPGRRRATDVSAADTLAPTGDGRRLRRPPAGRRPLARPGHRVHPVGDQRRGAFRSARRAASSGWHAHCLPACWRAVVAWTGGAFCGLMPTRTAAWACHPGQWGHRC